MKAYSTPNERIIVILTRPEAERIRQAAAAGIDHADPDPTALDLYCCLDDALEETRPGVTVEPTSFDMRKRSLTLVGIEELEGRGTG